MSRESGVRVSIEEIHQALDDFERIIAGAPDPQAPCWAPGASPWPIEGGKKYAEALLRPSPHEGIPFGRGCGAHGFIPESDNLRLRCIAIKNILTAWFPFVRGSYKVKGRREPAAELSIGRENPTRVTTFAGVGYTDVPADAPEIDRFGDIMVVWEWIHIIPYPPEADDVDTWAALVALGLLDSTQGEAFFGYWALWSAHLISFFGARLLLNGDRNIIPYTFFCRNFCAIFFGFPAASRGAGCPSPVSGGFCRFSSGRCLLAGHPLDSRPPPVGPRGGSPLGGLQSGGRVGH